MCGVPPGQSGYSALGYGGIPGESERTRGEPQLCSRSFDITDTHCIVELAGVASRPACSMTGVLLSFPVLSYYLPICDLLLRLLHMPLPVLGAALGNSSEKVSQRRLVEESPSCRAKPSLAVAPRVRL
jgi:hypothetical protein